MIVSFELRLKIYKPITNTYNIKTYDSNWVCNFATKYTFKTNKVFFSTYISWHPC